MRIQIDFEDRLIHLLDTISIQDLNMLIFKHKLGEYDIAGIFGEEQEEIDLGDELLPTTSVANYYDNKDD